MEEYLQQVRDLIKQKNYQAAYKLCIEIINADPDNGSAIRLKSEIEQLVEEQNIFFIEEDLKNLEPLWESKDYAQLIERLQKLYTYAPHYTKTKELLIKAQNLLNQKTIDDRNQLIEEKIAEMKQLASEAKFVEAIEAGSKIHQFTTINPKIEKTLRKIRRAYAKYLLKTKKELLNSENYKEIVEFLSLIKDVDPTYNKIPKLIQKFQRHYFSQQDLNKREYLFQGIENMKTLYQKGKYDKSLKAAKEIIQIDPKNVIAKKFQKKSIHKQEKIMIKEIQTMVTNNFLELHKEYIQDKKSVIKI